MCVGLRSIEIFFIIIKILILILILHYIHIDNYHKNSNFGQTLVHYFTVHYKHLVLDILKNVIFGVLA